MAAVGRPDLGIDNPMYATDAKRCERESEICAIIGEWVESHPSSHVMSELNEARVPAGPILSIADIMREEQYIQRNMFHTATTPPSPSGEKKRRFH